MTKFLVLGNINAMGFKEIIPLIKNNKLWAGAAINNNARWCQVPDDYEPKAKGYKELDGKKYILVNGLMYYTNMDHYKRHQPLPLTHKYSPEKYPKYDNYDAINVDRTKDIPCDYFGPMGVPVSFVNKWCPEQFQILGVFNNHKVATSDPEQGHIYGEPVWLEKYKFWNRGPMLNGKPLYTRIIIKRK